MTETATVDQAVTPLRTALGADGYELHVEAEGSRMILRIVAGPEACEDCLVPPAVMEPMISQVLEDAGASGVEWDLVYPTG